MFDNRSGKDELLDNLTLNNSELRKNLDEMEVLNNWFGSKKSLINSLNKIIDRYSEDFSKQKIVIADLGCGNGDLLRQIAIWEKSKKLNSELLGFDVNPHIIQYAQEKSSSYPIEYRNEDILSHDFLQNKFDIVCLNSVCHHFTDAELIHLLQTLKQNTRFSIIINDLQRHWLSYYFVKLMTKVLNFTYLGKNDGPISVLRAFRKQELILLLEKANIKTYQINWKWAFRWQLIIWCKHP